MNIGVCKSDVKEQGSTDNDDSPCSSSGKKSSLMECTDFLKALNTDLSHITACYRADGSIRYISQSVIDILGFSVDEVTEDEFPLSHSGDTVFRSHCNGSCVQFSNTFYFKALCGDIYTIDKVLPMAPEDTYVVVKDEKGEILSVKGLNLLADKLRPLTGTALPSLVKSNGFENVLLNAKVSHKPQHLNFCGELVFDSEPNVGISVSFDTYSMAGGNLVTCMRSHGDISALSETGRDLRMQSLLAEIEYLRDFRDNALLPIYSVNAEGRIVWANDAMLRMMGYVDHRTEYLGSDTTRHHVDQALVSKMFGIVLEGGLLEDFPCRLIRRDGTVFHATYNSNCRFDKTGTMSYSRCIVQDITESLRVEQAKLVIAEEQKRIAQHNERAASEMKSAFLATMSHEIRTPINGVIGTTSLLSTTEMSEEQRDYVETIGSSADILMSLVHNILDISKIESGKFELDKFPIHVGELITKTCRIMRAQAREKGVNFITSIEPALADCDCWHSGDPIRLNQIISNFLSNAVKFTHDGGTVECRVGIVNGDVDTDLPDSDSNLVLVEVCDTGIGIDDCSKLFQDFVQAAAHINKHYGGTGLGLSISRKLAEMMNGEVGMTSELGKGTCVWAKIPLPRVAVPKFPAEPSCGGDTEGPPKRANSIVVQVLVAEDNKVNQKMLRRMLEKLGYDAVTMTSDGQMAVDAVKTSWAAGIRFDIILMDCLMPQMDGWEATAAIRKLEQECGSSPSVILALTANATEEDKAKSFAMGMNDFLVKPITMDRLQVDLSRWVAKLPSSVKKLAAMEPDSLDGLVT